MRFLSAGALGVSLYYFILYILTDVVGVWYMASAIIASVANYSSNFIFQKFCKFRNKNTDNIQKQVGKYVVMVMFLFVANLLLLHTLVEYAHLWYMKAQAIVTIVLTLVSYLISKRIFTIQSPVV